MTAGIWNLLLLGLKWQWNLILPKVYAKPLISLTVLYYMRFIGGWLLVIALIFLACSNSPWNSRKFPISCSESWAKILSWICFPVNRQRAGFLFVCFETLSKKKSMVIFISFPSQIQHATLLVASYKQVFIIFFAQIRMAFATPEKTEQRVGGDF